MSVSRAVEHGTNLCELALRPFWPGETRASVARVHCNSGTFLATSLPLEKVFAPSFVGFLFFFFFFCCSGPKNARGKKGDFFFPSFFPLVCSWRVF